MLIDLNGEELTFLIYALRTKAFKSEPEGVRLKAENLQNKLCNGVWGSQNNAQDSTQEPKGLDV